MHHHHPHTAAAATTTTMTSANTPPAAVPATKTITASVPLQQAPPPTTTTSNSAQPPTQRRRKKRPNYGTRTVEVRRGYNGFGFTISGQQPCRLSCIIANSPADQAGLRAGDFLISVNGLNVSKLPHETVVQLIGNSFGSIRMQIAEHYYSDSTDEENAVAAGMPMLPSMGPSRPRYIYHKIKQQRLRQHLPQKKSFDANVTPRTSSGAATVQLWKKLPQPLMKSISVEAAAAANKRKVNEKLPSEVPAAAVHSGPSHLLQQQAAVATANFRALVMRGPTSAALEYRAIVGYLGTIEMPKQIANSSKLQTVRSCIRKLRQEKRQPTVVLMIILPDCLKLQANNGKILATYPSARLNYVSSSSESENRFFGLVTSAVYSPQLDDVDDEDDEEERGEGDDQVDNANNHHGGDQARANNVNGPGEANDRRPPALGTSSSVDNNVIISNSCHVFVVDTKLCEHQQHLAKAQEFCIECTKDPISNLCLEFPNNSEYVVNLIRSMYTMRIVPPITQRSISDDPTIHGRNNHENIAHSPQPSNHSEVSTTTSNSDSGIGYNNDCSNVTDRIVLVDFPVHNAAAAVRVVPGANNANAIASPKRPQNICEQSINSQEEIPSSSKHMVSPALHIAAAIEQTKSSYNSPGRSLTVSRSCDDVLNLIEQESEDNLHNLDNLTTAVPFQQCYASMDDISLYTASMENEDNLKTTILQRNPKSEISTPHDNATENREERRKSLNLKITTSNSLQNISIQEPATGNDSSLNKLASTPDLSRIECNDSLSTFERGWIQTSLRTPRADKHTIHLSAPSQDNATDGQPQSQQFPSPSISRSASMSNSSERSSFKKKLADSLKSNLKKGPTAWGTSIEMLLADPAGLKTFAEFLKLEYAAENIYFWTACERYRNLESENERREQALEIFKKHLSSGSMEPVNVDSQARCMVERNLGIAGPDLFHPAQKQIFNLMKFDSYQRFLRSELYKQCLQAEKKGKSLPYSGDNLDELLKTTNFSESASLKLKKSASNVEEGRPRRSLLPWHRKTRSKSRDQIAQDSVKEQPTISSTKNQGAHGLKPNVMHGSASSLTSFDALSFNNNVCRIKFPDGATTMVQIKSQETVAELVERLMEKRSIRYQFFDVSIKGPPSKSVDLKSLAKELANKEVEIEQRVAFKLDLPIPKVISVKSKPRKQLYEVVRPILQRYHINPELVEVLMRETQTKVDLTQLVTAVNEQRLQVVYKKEVSYHRKAPTIAKKTIADGLQTTQITLDEITNKVFSDLMQVKQHQEEAAASAGTAMKPKVDQCSTKSEECPSESSSSFFKLMKSKRESMNANAAAAAALAANRGPNKTKKTATQHSSSLLACDNKIIPNKLKSGGIKLPLPLKMADKQDDLLEDLKRAQLARLEDQRGTEINFELPEFLKYSDNLNKSNASGEKPTAEEEHGQKETPTFVERPPQPAPRHSISNKSKLLSSNTSPMKNDINMAIERTSEKNDNNTTPSKGPPPLPPKPKVLPIKPSNWGVNILQLRELSPTTPPPPLSPSPSSSLLPTPTIASPQLTNVNVVAVPASSSNSSPNGRCAYLDQPSSSFV